MEAADIEWEVARQDGGAAWLHCDRGMELSNVLSGFVGQYVVRQNHTVFVALTLTNSGTSLVFEGTEREGEGWEALVDFSKEGSGALQLEVVDRLEFTFVDSRAELSLLWLAFTG